MEPDAELHPELTGAFEALVRAAAELLLDFQLDLASATVSLARRVRAVSADSLSAGVEIGSMVSGLEALADRVHREASLGTAPDLAMAIALMKSYRDGVQNPRPLTLVPA